MSRRQAPLLVLGVGILVFGVLWGAGLIADPPTGVIELVGDKGNGNDEMLARWAIALAFFLIALILLGAVSTPWLRRDSGASTGAEAVDLAVGSELAKTGLLHGRMLHVIKDDIADLKQRAAELENDRAVHDLAHRLDAVEARVEPRGCHEDRPDKPPASDPTDSGNAQ